LDDVSPRAVLAQGVEGMRGLGLSLPKARYAVALAEAEMNWDSLSGLADAEAHAVLVALKGIGRWTAEVYLMFTQGRVDMFPGGDVALQEAMRWMDRTEVRPTEKQAYRRAELWRPYRGVAAHLLWAFYGAVKRREIAPF
jgi:DNA-3-methyladenine glycosylase II